MPEFLQFPQSLSEGTRGTGGNWRYGLNGYQIANDKGELLNDKENVGGIIELVFKAVALAMAVAAFVVNALSAAPVGTQVVLLEIGLFGLAMSSLLHGGHDEK